MQEPKIDILTTANFNEALNNIFTSGTCYSQTIIAQLLHSIRVRLDMEVAFVAEFYENRRIFRFVDAQQGLNIIQVGASDPLDQSYCAKIANGSLPELMPDARKNLLAASMEVTHILPVGAHLSVPIRLSDGRIWGTFCTFSRKPNSRLKAKDLATLRVFADVAAVILEHDRDELSQRDLLRQNICSLVQKRELDLVFQPIFNTESSDILGFEALCRPRNKTMPTEQLFRQASELGLGLYLDTYIIKQALYYLNKLKPYQYLSINISPELACSDELAEVFKGYDNLERLVLEITEHTAVYDYNQVLEALAPLRTKGIKLAVDDAGAGYASLRHILLLKPDIIKLDISLIRDINRYREKQALTSALVEFSRRCGYRLIAEGVETTEELEELQRLGIFIIQGYLVSKPYPFQHFNQSQARSAVK